MLTDFHNAGLSLALDGLAGTLAGIDITALDVHQAFEDLLADPLAFGFTNPSIPCLSASVTGVPTGACAAGFDAGGAVFWDPLHPATAAHAVLAGLVTVPEPSALALFGFGVAGLGLLRRRRIHASPSFLLAARIGRRSARLLEAGAALALLVYFAPCIAVVAAAVRASGPGPLFQRCEVAARDGRLGS